MKRILTTLCALAFVMAGSIPALAAEADADTGQSASYYPISVEEYTYGSLDEPRVEKVYQLSLSDDPSGIPTEDFVRNGRLYYLLDMTRKNEVGVDMDPNWVVNHAYNVASYILANDNPIEDGETVDGVEDGQMSRNVQWKCRYEDALIQPPRAVLDINMGEYAAGNRT